MLMACFLCNWIFALHNYNFLFNSDTHCLQRSLFIFKFCQPQNKRTFVSTANKPLVRTLMTISDVTVSIAIASGKMSGFIFVRIYLFI